MRTAMHINMNKQDSLTPLRERSDGVGTDLYSPLSPEVVVEDMSLYDFSGEMSDASPASQAHLRTFSAEEWERESCLSKARWQVKYVLEEPDQSSHATCVQFSIISLIMVSTLVVIVETVPELDRDYPEVFSFLEKVFTALFTAEILVRIWIADNGCSYFSSLGNLVDILSTLPWYLETFIFSVITPVTSRVSWLRLTPGTSQEATDVADAFYTLRLIRMVRMVRLLRVLRLAKAARHSEIITTVLGSVHDSLQGICALLVFLCMGSIFSATIVFHVECEVEGTEFTSIPAALWWAFPTITGVGYGDMLPRSMIGRGCAMGTMIMGILITSVSAAMVTTSFMDHYQRNTQRLKLQRVTMSKAKRKSMQLLHGQSAAQEHSQSKVALTLANDLTRLSAEVEDVLNRLEGVADNLPHMDKTPRSRRSQSFCSISLLREQNKAWFRHTQQIVEEVLEQQAPSSPSKEECVFATACPS
eukprot:TRINITY_DN23789_c0_g1_i1.p1 TRINITY_DN23789_c0_g1~~TRINITY_DN23789_c0_g1_i1.p1  ORF type:complete len:474 (+),score=99.31 TRINITY_DN23789_c0_g1_i1:113-1534(+)